MITNSHPSIDEKMLARLVRQDRNGELVSLYLSEAADTLASVRLAVMTTDASRLREAAHRLKGSSGYVGAMGVQTLSDQLEQIGRSGLVADHAAVLLEQLEGEFAQVREKLETLSHL